MFGSTGVPALPGAIFLLLYGLVSLPLLWRNDALPDFAGVSTLLAAALAALSAIDVTRYRLPDVLTLPLIAGGVLIAWWIGTMTVWWSALSAAVGFLALFTVARVYHLVRGRPGLGLGDAKLLAGSGAWLGAEALPTTLLWATGGALVYVLVLAVRDRALSGATRIPFGPFLCFGTWLVWLYGAVH